MRAICIHRGRIFVINIFPAKCAHFFWKSRESRIASGARNWNYVHLWKVSWESRLHRVHEFRANVYANKFVNICCGRIKSYFITRVVKCRLPVHLSQGFFFYLQRRSRSVIIAVMRSVGIVLMGELSNRVIRGLECLCT